MDAPNFSGEGVTLELVLVGILKVEGDLLRGEPVIELTGDPFDDRGSTKSVSVSCLGRGVGGPLVSDPRKTLNRLE